MHISRQGFLRRVQCYPVLLSPEYASPTTRRRQSISTSTAQPNVYSQSSPTSIFGDTSGFSKGLPHAPVSSEHRLSPPVVVMESLATTQPRTSVAEKVLEQLQLTIQRTGSIPSVRTRTVSSTSPEENGNTCVGQGQPTARRRVNSDTLRQSTYSMASEASEGTKRSSLHNPPTGSILNSRALGISRSPSVTAMQHFYTSSSQGSMQTLNMSPPPPELISMLEGEHHTDELCARFEVGWPLLQQWLTAIGGGKGGGDFGRVALIYR